MSKVARSNTEASVKEGPSWEEVIRRVRTGYQPTPEERAESLRELLKGIPTWVSLSDEDLRRENLYEDRW